jgi:hypothetical protein
MVKVQGFPTFGKIQRATESPKVSHAEGGKDSGRNSPTGIKPGSLWHGDDPQSVTPRFISPTGETLGFA